VAAAFLLKGSPENLSWSLQDMKSRKSGLLKGKPENWMVWGVNEKFKWILQQLEGAKYSCTRRRVPGSKADSPSTA
jgi:hypothetical protein